MFSRRPWLIHFRNTALLHETIAQLDAQPGDTPIASAVCARDMPYSNLKNKG